MHALDLPDPSSRVLPRLLTLQAQAIGDQPFLIEERGALTFAEAESLCARLAGGLVGLGVKRGDHVAFLLRNRREAVLIALAANRLGAIWVPVNADYRGQWLADTLTRSRPKVVITQDELTDRLEDIDLPGQVIVVDGDDWNSLLASEPLEPDYAGMEYGDTAAVVWTSGTTGRSKGVLVSHNGWIRPIVKGTSLLYRSQPGDVIFNVLPLYHAAAWNTAVFRALIEGLPVVIEPHFSVQNYWDRIEQFGATQGFLLGAMATFLWQAPESERDASQPLRVLQAIPMPADLIEPFEQRFGLRIVGGGFGQSECMMITTMAGHEGPAPANTMGYGPDDVEVGIFDDQDQRLPPGQVGEIRVRPLAPHVICNGYLDDAQATEDAWRGEWFCTGDLGRVDENGAFFFADRKKDAVRFAGRNISTLEVEGVVRSHPDVADVAAFGIPSPISVGEDELKLNVVKKPGSDLDAETLARFINDHAPHWFVPRYLEFVDALPYTPTNKVQKFKLREAGVGPETWDRDAAAFKVQR